MTATPSTDNTPGDGVALVVAIVAAPAAAIIGWLLLIQLQNAPIADDFAWLAAERDRGAWGFIGWFLTLLTGRYANATLMGGSIAVFGEAAVRILPPLLLLALLAAVAVLLGRAVRAASDDGVRSRGRAVGAGLAVILLAASAAAMPSVYDSLIWFNSVCIFLASAAAAAWLLVVWTAPAARSDRRVARIGRLGVLAAVTLIAQGFAESTSAMIIGVAVLALVLAMRFPAFAARRLEHLVVLVAGVVGLLLVYLLPGTAARNAIQAELFPENSIGRILGGVLQAVQIPVVVLTSWRVVGVLALAVALAACFSGVLRRYPVRAAILGAAFAAGPVLATGLITAITVQSGPYRAQTLPVVLSVGGLALLIALGLTAVAHVVPHRARIGAVAAAVVAVGLLVVPAPAFATIGQAVASRAGLVDFRSASIGAQLASGTEVVAIAPAPLLLASTEATEFSYTDAETGWFQAGFASWYGIDRPLVRDRLQPAGYCLALDRSIYPDTRNLAAYYGVRSCGDLGAPQ